MKSVVNPFSCVTCGKDKIVLIYFNRLQAVATSLSAWSQTGLLFLLLFGVSVWPCWENEWRKSLNCYRESFWIPEECALLHMCRITQITGFKVLKRISSCQNNVYFFPLNFVSWFTSWCHLCFSQQFHTEIRPSAITAAFKMPFFLSALTDRLFSFEVCSSFLKCYFFDCLEAAYFAKIYSRRFRFLRTFISVKQCF